MQVAVYGDTLCAQVTATALAQTGHQVAWYVFGKEEHEQLNQEQPLFNEQGLDRLYVEQISAGRLVPLLRGQSAVDISPSEVVFLALSPGSETLAEDILDVDVKPGACRLVVNQTVGPVGVAERLRQYLLSAGYDAALVALPDLIQEGNAFLTFTRPESILLGCYEREGEALMRELLRPFNRRKDVLQVMSLREAEFAKLAISGILATRISFMNDMAALSESLDVDIDAVRVAMGADSRIGEAYLYPGCGFGGPGLSSNVLALLDAQQQKAAEPGLLEQVLHTNERQKEVLFRKFWQYCNGCVKDKRVAIWGASFKPGTARVENAPALKIIEALWAQGVDVAVHDPKALPDLKRWAEKQNKELLLCDTPYEATLGADALMLVTEWKPYWSPDWQRLKQEMRTGLILDGRNIYDPAFVKAQGLEYRGIGRS